MNCKEYRKLTLDEQRQLIGKITHLVQNNSEYFRLVNRYIERAERKGLLKDVLILSNEEIIQEMLNQAEP